MNKILPCTKENPLNYKNIILIYPTFWMTLEFIYLFFLSFFLKEKVSSCIPGWPLIFDVVEVGFEPLPAFLLSSPMFWDYRHTPPYLA